MLIREYKSSDLPSLVGMFRRQAFEYVFPDLEDPVHVQRMVLEEGGRPVAAAIGRLTAEMYLLVDPDQGDPKERWLQIAALHGATESYLGSSLKLAEIHAFLPPRIEAKFGRRLERLAGWFREPWPCYTLALRTPEGEQR